MRLIVFIIVISTFSGMNLLKGDEISGTNGKWEYRVRITSPGSRSEGRIGTIYYNTKVIKYNFDEMLLPLGEYRFFVSPYRWGSYGYRKISINTSHDFIATKVTSVIELKKILALGYYNGKEKIKMSDKEWIRVMKDNDYWWINPEKLQEFINERRWNSRSPLLQLISPEYRFNHQIKRIFGN